MSVSRARTIGDGGEDKACAWLVSAGFSLVARNVQTPFGEIDIIAKKGKVLHFIEVKTRNSTTFGVGAIAISSSKLSRMIKSAQSYMSKQSVSTPFQIDVISIDQEKIRMLENVTL